jgi:hypothetical protein
MLLISLDQHESYLMNSLTAFHDELTLYKSTAT